MTTKILQLAAVLAVTVASLPAQTGGVTPNQFQQAGQIGQVEPAIARPATLMPGGRGASAQVVAGKRADGKAASK